MAISFLSGSWQDDLETRVSNNGGGGGLAGRTTALENWRGGMSFSADLSADLDEDLSALTLLANVKDEVESHAVKLNAVIGQVNEIKAALVA